MLARVERVIARGLQPNRVCDAPRDRGHDDEEDGWQEASAGPRAWHQPQAQRKHAGAQRVAPRAAQLLVRVRPEEVPEAIAEREPRKHDERLHTRQKFVFDVAHEHVHERGPDGRVRDAAERAQQHSERGGVDVHETLRGSEHSCRAHTKRKKPAVPVRRDHCGRTHIHGDARQHREHACKAGRRLGEPELGVHLCDRKRLHEHKAQAPQRAEARQALDLRGTRHVCGYRAQAGRAAGIDRAVQGPPHGHHHEAQCSEALEHRQRVKDPRHPKHVDDHAAPKHGKRPRKRVRDLRVRVRPALHLHGARDDAVRQAQQAAEHRRCALDGDHGAQVARGARALKRKHRRDASERRGHGQHMRRGLRREAALEHCAIVQRGHSHLEDQLDQDAPKFDRANLRQGELVVNEHEQCIPVPHRLLCVQGQGQGAHCDGRSVHPCSVCARFGHIHTLLVCYGFWHALIHPLHTSSRQV